MRGGLGKLKKQKLNARFWAIVNLAFIFIFLNIWDFAVNKLIFNGMAVGAVLFLPVAFLWYLNRFRAIVLLTMLSIFEFMVMFVFVWEGFELSGASYSAKSIFWLPFLVAAGVNGYLGLNLYSKRVKQPV